jgi:hypothetical protein
MIEELGYDVGLDTHRRNDSVDIPAALPEYVRPALLSTATRQKSATRSVAFRNDGVVE